MRGILRMIPASYGGNYSPLTTAWITATGESNPTILNALNTFEAELTSIGLSKFYYLYPFVGGTAYKHSLNFLDTASFQTTWSGGVTHNSNGYEGNGTTGYGNTGFNPTTAGVVSTDFGITTYSRTATVQVECYVGVQDGASQIILFDFGTTRSPAVFDDSSFIFVDATTRVGLQTIIRDGATSQIFYKDGVSFQTSARPTLASINRSLYISARNNGGTADWYSKKNIALQVAHKALSPADMVSLNTANVNFQTALSRFL